MSASLPRLVDMRQAMKTAHEELPFFIDDFALPGFLTVLVGQHSAWKSWLTLLLAHRCHSGGGELAGLQCEEAPALFVDGENGSRLFARRFRAAAIPHDGLVVLDGFGLRLPGAKAELERYIKATGSRLVVLDSQRRLAPGTRENDSDDMAPLIGGLAEVTRALEVAIVLIHHRSTKFDAPDVRGSSAIEDQVDALFVLEHVRGDPDRLRRRLRTVKFRMDTEPPDRWVEFNTGSGIVTVEEAEPFEQSGAPAKPTAVERMIDRVRALESAVTTDGGWPPGRLAEALGVDPDSRTLRRALGGLTESGEWTVTGATSSRRYSPVATSGLPVIPYRGAPDDRKSENGHHELTDVAQQQLETQPGFRPADPPEGVE